MSTTTRDPGSPWWKEWHGPIGSLPGTREDYVGINAVDPIISYSPHAAHLWNAYRTRAQIFAARPDVQSRPAPTRDMVLEMFTLKKLLVESLQTSVRLPSDPELASAYGRCAPVPLDQGPIWYPRRKDFQGNPRSWGMGAIAINGEVLLQIGRSQNVNKDPHGLIPVSCANIITPMLRWTDDTLRLWFNKRVAVTDTSGTALQAYFTGAAKGEPPAHGLIDAKFSELTETEWATFDERTQLVSPEGDQFSINSENPTFDPEQKLPVLGQQFIVLYDGKPYKGTVAVVKPDEAKAILDFGPGTPPGEYDLGELLPVEEWQEELDKAAQVAAATSAAGAATPTSGPSGV